MNLRKLLGSKKIFFLSLLPSIFIFILVYSEYLNGKNKLYDGCGWVSRGEEGCKSYLDYIGESLGGWEFTILGNLFFIVVSLLLLGTVYSLAHKKNKISSFLFMVLLVLIFLFLFSTGRLF